MFGAEEFRHGAPILIRDGRRSTDCNQGCTAMLLLPETLELSGVHAGDSRTPVTMLHAIVAGDDIADIRLGTQPLNGQVGALTLGQALAIRRGRGGGRVIAFQPCR